MKLNKNNSEVIYILDEESIYELEKRVPYNGDINSVITLINLQTFGMIGYQDYYNLYYITNRPHLHGLCIDIYANSKNHNEITLLFAKEIAQRFPDNNLNFLDVANAFQEHKKTYYSKTGYFVTDLDAHIKKYGIESSILFSNSPINIPHFDKLSFYKDIFKKIDFDKIYNNTEKSNKIYILYNSRNNLFKIGRSINAKYREKTLQGEDPQIDMLACWIAPESEEKALHAKFKCKRSRGEWFDLDLDDLTVINNIMDKYR